jgi:hypothetical protein
MREEFRATAKYLMPTATREKVEAHVFKQAYEVRHNAQEPEDPELTLRP